MKSKKQQLAAVLTITGIVLSCTAAAQGEADDYGPDKSNWVRASCKSKEMPRQGYDIGERLPGGDCLWARDRDKRTYGEDATTEREEPRDRVDPEEIRRDEDRGRLASGDRPSLPAELRGNPTLTAAQADEWALSKHRGTLHAIDLQRAAANQTYLQAFNSCGANVDCQAEAAGILNHTNQRLDSAAKRANAALRRDLTQINAYFTHPDNPNP